MFAWSMLYQLLKTLSIYTIEGKEVTFAESDIWKNHLELENDLSIVCEKKKRFFLLLERAYDMQIPEKEKQSVVTIGDLKDVMTTYSKIVD